MKYRVTHLTAYAYAEPVSLSHHLAHLTPRSDNGQICTLREIRIAPIPVLRRERIDAFGNRATYFSIEEPHRNLVVESRCEVAVSLSRPPAGYAPSWDAVKERICRERRADLGGARAYTFDSPLVAASAALADYARPSFAPGRPLLEAVGELNGRIYRDFVYDPAATHVATPVGEALASRRGVCQDFSHVAIGCLRSLGLPARYVSGYLRTRPPPGRPRLVGADASHAWISVHFPDFGWVDFDPTNGLVPGDEHITIAYGRDFSDVAPVRGVILGGGAHEVTVSVDVTPLG